MIELVVRIRFVTPCLGKTKKHYRARETVRYKFIFERGPDSCVIFVPTWWRAITVKAADVFGRYQRDVRNIRFGCRIDGQPENELYKRYYEPDKFACHEYFAAGKEIGFTCVVPTTLPIEDFERILTIAGEYYGISPARPNEFGIFQVVSVERRRHAENDKTSD